MTAVRSKKIDTKNMKMTPKNSIKSKINDVTLQHKSNPDSKHTPF